MIGIKPILRIVSVLTVAFAAGQLTETLRDQPAAGVEVSAAADVATDVGTVTGITPVAATTDGGTADDCAPALRLAALPGAMIDLTLSAPCNRGERVVLRHSDLSFTGVIGPDGQLRLKLPALEGLAMVAAYLEDAQVALGQITVPDLGGVTRFAVHMPAPAQFDLRAATADRVYVSSRSPVGDDTARVVSLGAAQAVEPIMAQVYTHPEIDLSGVELSLDLRITHANCGRTLPLESWLSQNGQVTHGTFFVDVPACGTSGDILVLKNLLPAPTLVSSD